MSNTIKVVHMCDHVVPESEITTETNAFATGTDVCQISENPIYLIDRIEYFGVDATLNPGSSTLSLEHCGKIDNFSYQIDDETFSEPIELCKAKTFLDLKSKTKIRGEIKGTCFPDGFMFGKTGVDPATQISVTGGVAGHTEGDSVWAKGDGSNAVVSFVKPVLLTDFTNLFLHTYFEIPENCTLLQLKLTVPGISDAVVFEKTAFELENEGWPIYTLVSLKISIPGSQNFNAAVSGEAILKVSMTMPSALAATDAYLKMSIDNPGIGIPTFVDLNGTGYEHLSEETLQYIFSTSFEYLYEPPDSEPAQSQGIHTEFGYLLATSGCISNVPTRPIDYSWGWDVIDPETGLSIYNRVAPERIIIPVDAISPLTNYTLSNNAGYANIIYWVNPLNECIGVSRGSEITSPDGAIMAFVCSEEGEVYTESVRYYLRIEGAAEADQTLKNLIVDTGVSIYGIPYGVKDYYDIETSVLARYTKQITLTEDNVVSLYTGSLGHDLITLAPFSRSAEFTTTAKEFKTFSWFAPEIDATELENITLLSGHTYHYSCPVDQCVKILIPKGMAVNLTDAKLKFAGVQFIYELEFPEETASYKLMLENMDFTRLGQNAIKWDQSSPWVTDAGKTLVATLETKCSINRRYDEYFCPRCSGNGWYVSTTADASRAVEHVTGSDKMVQDFLKILLTDIRYYKPGTAFITLKGFVKRDKKIEDLIVLYIKDAEMQLRQLQYNMSIAGSEISKYEELKTVIIESIDATSSQDRIYVEIRLVNMASEYTTIGLAV